MQHDAAPIATNRHPAQENELVVSASEGKKTGKELRLDNFYPTIIRNEETEKEDEENNTYDGYYNFRRKTHNIDELN